MLAVESLFEDRKLMSTMNTNGVPWYVCRRKKWKPHDVISWHMRHKKIIDLGLAWAVILHDLLSETAQAGTHIANRVVFAINDFHARRVTAITMPDGKIQLRIDEPLNSRFAIELPAVRLQQGLFDFLPDVFASRRNRKGSSRPPTPDPHRSSKNNATPRRTQICYIPIRGNEP